MKPDKLAVVMPVLIVVLLVSHLAQDIVFGYEPAKVATLFALPIVALWLYLALAVAGRGSGYLLLIIGALASAVVPIIHMSGGGVRQEVVQSSGGFFFIWTLLALAVSASASILLAIHGLWSLRRGAHSVAPNATNARASPV
ncbi:MAG: hypothetical protein WAU68_04725 [Vitreimonas sp.]